MQRLLPVKLRRHLHALRHVAVVHPQLDKIARLLQALRELGGRNRTEAYHPRSMQCLDREQAYKNHCY